VEAIVDVARWTGSARNRQPWRVVAVRDAARRGELSRLGAYATFVADAPLILLLGVDTTLGADAEFDAGRFAQSLMLAAHDHGLGTCPVTFFPDENVARATGLAGLDDPWRVRTGICLGWPQAAAPAERGRSTVPLGRRPVAEILVDR
jgi:nitroreductase